MSERTFQIEREATWDKGKGSDTFGPTGTPPGAGMGQKPLLYLKGVETMRLDIDRLGEQTQRVLASIQ